VVNRKHFALRVVFTENGQLKNISKAPRYFRHSGKPNYSRIVEDLLKGKESIESNSETKADVISRLRRKGISEKWVQEYFAKPKKVVSRLSGTLTPNVSVQDYKKHLEMKYGR
jgi:hypothetical protein